LNEVESILVYHALRQKKTAAFATALKYKL